MTHIHALLIPALAATTDLGLTMPIALSPDTRLVPRLGGSLLTIARVSSSSPRRAPTWASGSYSAWPRRSRCVWTTQLASSRTASCATTA